MATALLDLSHFWLSGLIFSIRDPIHTALGNPGEHRVPRLETHGLSWGWKLPSLSWESVLEVFSS